MPGPPGGSYNWVVGTSGDDVLIGNSSNQEFYGLAGDDYIAPGMGLFYFSGSSSVFGDKVDGGDGTDTVSYEDSTLGVEVNLLVGRGTGGFAERDTYISIENIVGSTHGDMLIGDDGANRINGYDGDDTLMGGPAADVLIGGNGNDTASYAADSGGVFVNLTLARGYGNAAEGDVFDTIENVIGTASDDFIIGDTGVNRLDGAAGNDILIGAIGDDILIGGDGSDWASYEDNSGTVFVDLLHQVGFNNAAEGDSYEGIENVIGGLFDDTLIGDDGDNRLDGAMGADTLVGNAGNDIFVFSHAPGASNPFGGDNVDTLFDFLSGADKLEISSGAFGGGLAAGSLANGAFVLGSAAGDADDRFIYDHEAGKLWFDADGSGSGAAQLVALLPNHNTISVDDFIIV